jgi:phosphoglycerate dehydrogenase-like enzyme
LAAADSNSPNTNKTDRWQLAGYVESDASVAKHPSYRKLKTVAVGFASPELMSSLKSQFPSVSFVPLSELSADANDDIDAVFLSCGNPAALDRLPNLAWIHSYSAGVEGCVEHPFVVDREVLPVVTNSSGTAAAVIAEHSIAMMMSMARGLHRFRDEQNAARWSRDILAEGGVTTTVAGKTMLVLGLGSIGRDVALRANALGMKVTATRNRSRSGPSYVDYVGLADETLKLASEADVIVNALPLTESTAGLLNEEFFAAMKPTAILVSVGRGGTTDTDALLKALKNGEIAGAALDVTDPEPLPADHPLWKQQNVIITPHLAGTGGDSRERTFTLAAENLRRYLQGEALLNVIDINLGY